MQGKLFVTSTPIGNLGDITLRAIETLKKVDLILCEDTRVTKKMLDRFEIDKPLLSYHQRSKLSKTGKIIGHLEDGENLALVTDAGTPGISDPGNELIDKLLEHFNNEIEIISIPGPSALTALIQVSGVNMKEFMFLGFPPHKKGREKFFKRVAASEMPIIYYESPYRILKNLQLLEELSRGNKNVIVGRELTKIYEETKRGKIEQIFKYYKNNPDKVRGEFVVIVY